MYCPQCRGEYQDHVTMCAHCEVELVAELPPEDEFSSDEAMARFLRDKELEALVVANHVELQRLQRELAKERIATVIVGDDEHHAELGLPQRFYLMVAKEDFERSRDFFQQRWQSGLNTEGLMVHGRPDAVTADVCPACGTKVGEGTSECPECGLFLGDAEG
jgi:hypothetical protein